MSKSAINSLVNEMEDNLEIFSGFMKIGTWSSKYCILRDNELTLCDKKEGNIEGRIHLKVAVVSELNLTQPIFQINTGTTQIMFRTTSLATKSKWVNAL